MSESTPNGACFPNNEEGNRELAEGLHVFYQGAEPVYSRFRREASTRSGLKVLYHKERGYAEIADEIPGFKGLLLAEVSLPLATHLIAEHRGTADEIVIIGTLTTFRRGKEMTALYYPKGRLSEVEYLEVADSMSLATWLALMFLKSAGASLTRTPSTLTAHMRASKYTEIYDYAIRSLRAGVSPLLDSFLVAAWPEQFDELKALSEGKFEYREVYDWYWQNVSLLSADNGDVSLLSKVLVARRRDVDEKRETYQGYLDQWCTWKSSVAKAGGAFHMLHPTVELSGAEKMAGYEFIGKAWELLGAELLALMGANPNIRLDLERDFSRAQQ